MHQELRPRKVSHMSIYSSGETSAEYRHSIFGWFHISLKMWIVLVATAHAEA
jgi:hypothetical protein